ncbi:MAG TPA: adenylate/guanylate cyclase domain-containing protein [Turneriella sp.]|nr:adenylate/guanylate cyclase domain-containing protein [Turneriella sp.]
MSSTSHSYRNRVIRLALFLLVGLSLVFLFPSAQFRLTPYFLYGVLWCIIIATVFWNGLLHALVVQLSIIAMLVFLIAFDLKYRSLDLKLLVVWQSVIFLSLCAIGFLLLERSELREKVASQKKLAQELEGEKLNEINRLLAADHAVSFEELTILFSDIRGFSSIAEVLPANTLYMALNVYYEGVVEIVEQHGGIIDKFLGDGIMVVFGLGASKKNAPLKAIQCAIQMQEYQKGIEKISLPGKIQIGTGFGIATGRVMVGLVGATSRYEWTCLGDPVNLSARLEQFTRKLPTDTLVSETTMMQLPENSGVMARAVGYFKVRGRFTEETIYEVFNNDAEHIREGKNKTKEKFEKALKMQRRGFVDDARAIFREIHREYPDDLIARHYATNETVR